ncbi:MAG: NAD(P)H-dependent oxidoreductase [Alphaproteobacteria bacterium]|nr:NAD(P)H-dependent oxidoreductase [Alphaproteobacteria bacterium]
MIKVLFLAGSTRSGSFNKMLAKEAFQMAEDQGVQATYIDLRDFPMPLYDGDLEAEKGLPETAKRLKEVFVDHPAFLISSPEYNSSFSAVLKNTLDWISRKHEKDEATRVAFEGKLAALTAASPGALGGLRGLVPLRMMLGNMGVFVVPKQFALGKAGEAFDAEGRLISEQNRAGLRAVVDELIQVAEKLT